MVIDRVPLTGHERNTLTVAHLLLGDRYAVACRNNSHVLVVWGSVLLQEFTTVNHYTVYFLGFICNMWLYTSPMCGAFYSN